jgi:hypothetical protein
MNQSSGNKSGRRDWHVSATLLAVWIVALAVIAHKNIGIPFSMLAIATVFFVVLIPAMRDLVRSMEQFVARHFEETEQNRDQSEG